MYDEVIDALIKSKAMKVTKFISEKEIIRAVRTHYRFGFGRGNLEITLTRGKPNFVEREFVKRCKKHKLPFAPKVFLRFAPKRPRRLTGE